jgi:hypothetical protein
LSLDSPLISAAESENFGSPALALTCGDSFGDKLLLQYTPLAARNKVEILTKCVYSPEDTKS